MSSTNDDSTRSRIVRTALELFNRQGTRAVTTNHVARELGISPGNLYYHFRNKEEIVREIHARYAAETVAAWERIAARPPSADVMLDALRMMLLMRTTYRFLQTELYALVQRDPVLAAANRSYQEERLTAYGRIVAGWRDAGLLEPMSEVDFDDLVLGSWVLAETWPAWATAAGNPLDEQGIARGVRLVGSMFGPYLTPAAMQAMTQRNGDLR